MERVKRIVVLSSLCFFVLIVTGCDSDGEGVPEIIGPVSYRNLKPEPTVSEASTAKAKPYVPSPKPSGQYPRDWYPPKYCEKGWRAIVIHHSLTHNGNAAIFDRFHRKVRKWNGIGYDFVIGNGNGCGDGQVEVTYRWQQQITGAHCGGTPGNWANEDAIGICLVGDFNKSYPTSKQMRSLVKLVGFLKRRYRIPESKIYGHKETPGYTRGTTCPGTYFSMAKLKRML